MKRNVSLEEISDGKLYGLNDMVKAGCHDCEGCSACCKGMGNSIVVDPLDFHRLVVNSGCTGEQLMAEKLELNIVDGTILPSLKMAGEKECCVFLNEAGRCSIHSFRPGICRLFPLGRYYENGDFRYFLQIHECRRENRTKVKIRQWIDTPEAKRYEKFVRDWHSYLERLGEMTEEGQNGEMAKTVSLYVLTHFYLTPFSTEEDFYEQFEARLMEAERQADGWKS